MRWNHRGYRLVSGYNGTHEQLFYFLSPTFFSDLTTYIPLMCHEFSMVLNSNLLYLKIGNLLFNTLIFTYSTSDK